MNFIPRCGYPNLETIKMMHNLKKGASYGKRNWTNRITTSQGDSDMEIVKQFADTALQVGGAVGVFFVVHGGVSVFNYLNSHRPEKTEAKDQPRQSQKAQPV
jgi:hypothetical protein